MDSSKGKSIKMILVALVITIIFNSSIVWCKHDLIAWDECTDLMVELHNCSLKLHLPNSCDENTKSELLECAEAVLKNVNLCTDELGIQMIKYYVETFQHSDKVLCQKHLYSEFAQNQRCISIARNVAVRMAVTTPGALSEKGCTVLKSAVYLHGLDLGKACYNILTEYIDAMYDESPCAHVRLDAPSYDHLQEVRIVVTQLIACWAVYQDLHDCKNKLSKRMECLNAVNTTGLNKAFTLIGHNFVEVSKETEQVICNNRQLNQEFNDHKECWENVKTIGLLILGQANGFLTKNGCKAVKYRENITMASFEPQCVEILQHYRESMDKILPCHQAPGALAFAQSIHTSCLTFTHFLSIIGVVLLNSKLNSV